MISRRLLRIKVMKALYSHFQTEGESLIASQRNLLFSINKSYELYHLILHLIVDVADYAENVIEQRKTKLRPTEEDLNPNLRFVENRVISQLRKSSALNGYLSKNGLSWSKYPELIKKLFLNMSEKEYYSKYMNNTKCGYNEDKALVIAFYQNEIEDFDYLYEVLEEMSIYWMDEVEFITSYVIKTVNNMRQAQCQNEKSPDIVLMPLYRDEEDVEFVKELFIKSVVNYKQNISYIESFAKNWDVDRIAFMYKLLMLEALVEITEFPLIPVKVTLDEYIEISKYYSTANSSLFINGLLDRIAEDLMKKGKLHKIEKKTEEQNEK